MRKEKEREREHIEGVAEPDHFHSLVHFGSLLFPTRVETLQRSRQFSYLAISLLAAAVY